MYPLTLLPLAFAILLMQAELVSSHPQLQRSGSRKDEIACEKPEKYTTEWFLQNTKPKYRGELVKSGLFYSQGMSSRARKYARSKEHQLTTIWDVWPCYLYNNNTTPDNVMRCVHGNSKVQLTFFENMSRAFALKAREFATVLHSSENYVEPPKTGIWARIELPTLKKGGVDELEKINENESMSEIFWRRASTQMRKMDFRQKIDLRKRTDDASWRIQDLEDPLTDEQLAAFDNIEW